MKKKIFRVALIAAMAVAAGWNYQQNKQNVELSDLAMANVEALARGEWGDGHCNNCLKNFNEICWYEGVDGCLGHRLTEVR